MIEVALTDAVYLLSPRVTVLVNTLDERGTLNASPYSFAFPLAGKPPLIGIAIGNKDKLTYVNSKKTGEFVACTVSEEFGQQAVHCEEPHKAGDKLWEKYGLHAESSKKVKVPRIREARVVLECKVNRFVELDGGHVLLVGEVLQAEAEHEGLDEIKPLLHVSRGRFRGVGREIVLERRRRGK